MRKVSEHVSGSPVATRWMRLELANHETRSPQDARGRIVGRGQGRSPNPRQRDTLTGWLTPAQPKPTMGTWEVNRRPSQARLGLGFSQGINLV